MAIASSIILGLVETGASLVSGIFQNQQMNKSQAEARSLNERQLKESTAARKANERLQRMSLSVQRKQIAENTNNTEPKNS